MAFPCIEWTKTRLDETQQEIERSGSATEAARNLTARWGRKVSVDAIKHAFREYGRNSPGSYAREAFSSFRAGKVPDSGIKNTCVWVPPEGEPRLPDPGPSPVLRTTSSMRRILAIPDLHAPYQDKAAWQVCLNAAEVIRPDVIALMGDAADCYSVSTFTKDPERLRFIKDEFEGVKGCLQQIDALRAPRVIFLEGNHEFRLTRFIATRAPELHGMVDIPSYFGIRERGWEWVPYREHIMIGHMGFAHDLGRYGVYAARWTLHDFGGNITFGHTHRGGLVYEGTLHEGPRVCLNVGWLGDTRQVDYQHRAKVERESQLGFGLIYQEPDGISHAHFVPIVNGRCEVEGRVITG